MKQRRSMLIIPGNDPARLLHAELYKADSIVFELERAIATDGKDEARDLVKNALQYNAYSAEVGVHVNPLDGPFGHDDLTAIVKPCPAFIRLPNIREEEDLVQAEAFITNLERQYGHEAGRIKLALSLDTAQGILNAYRLAAVGSRVVALTFDGQRLAADLKARPGKEGHELLFAQSRLVLAARAAGRQVIDSLYTGGSDEEDLRTDTERGWRLGFDGKAVANPNDIALVHRIYSHPGGEEGEEK